MSASNREWPDEETVVARVGGRVRRLVEVVRRIERGRVGRTLPNLELTPNEQARAGRQEVGTPCGWAQACEMLRPGLGGLQAWGGRGRGLCLLSHIHSASPEPIVREDCQTPPQTHPGRVRSRMRSHDLPPMPPPPLEDHSSPLGCLVTPHRCPHLPPCIIVPDDVFSSLPPYSVRDPDAPPHYEDLFPPEYNPLPHMTPQQITP